MSYNIGDIAWVATLDLPSQVRIGIVVETTGFKHCVLVGTQKNWCFDPHMFDNPSGAQARADRINKWYNNL